MVLVFKSMSQRGNECPTTNAASSPSILLSTKQDDDPHEKAARAIQVLRQERGDYRRDFSQRWDAAMKCLKVYFTDNVFLRIFLFFVKQN